MGWNEPEKGKDPWKGKDQPPDLDETLKRIHEKFKKTFLGGGNKPGTLNSKNNGGAFPTLIAGALLLIWLISGIFIVDPAEQAVILRFGKYVETVGPGPHWIPRIICTKEVLNVDRVMDYSYSADMLTRDENLVSVSVAVQYRIRDLQDYLFNVANPPESLQQATSSVLRQVVGTTTADQILTEGREVWGSKVQENLVKVLGLYKTGIAIVNVSPQPARAPESVQGAFDEAIKAQEDEKRYKEQAYAYAVKVVPIAEGNASRIEQEAEAFAQQVVLRAQGEVAEFLALLPEYLEAPSIISERMYLDTMQNILSKTSKILIDGKSGNLLYLPLEKLVAQSANEVSTTSLKPSAPETASAMNDDSLLLAGRDLVRPVYSQGRD
jgi:membrane protease subunit HflK